ncbi:nitrile hydratase subunit alpha [Mycobacterium riyadhense]|uniref:nitrile hydratase subunit alpha n=1 Tax=Mycobacterium riyadhense TaxID=486698 RepID=UPI000A15919E|nr:nitrile hydratase subunit alpha [Mycobacterium riyadhense]
MHHGARDRREWDAPALRRQAQEGVGAGVRHLPTAERRCRRRRRLRDYRCRAGPVRVQIRAWDSSSDVRFCVVPRRPTGTEQMSEAELAALVTRDSMIGTGEPLEPAS